MCSNEVCFVIFIQWSINLCFFGNVSSIFKALIITDPATLMYSSMAVAIWWVVILNSSLLCQATLKPVSLPALQQRFAQFGRHRPTSGSESCGTELCHELKAWIHECTMWGNGFTLNSMFHFQAMSRRDWQRCQTACLLSALFKYVLLYLMYWNVLVWLFSLIIVPFSSSSPVFIFHQAPANKRLFDYRMQENWRAPLSVDWNWL